MITYVAIPYQAYQLTGSSLVVGLLGLAELVPLLVTAFVGGALADAFDRRRMMQITELALAAASAALVGNALLPHPQLWVLFVLAALMAMLDGLQRPVARRADAAARRARRAGRPPARSRRFA